MGSVRLTDLQLGVGLAQAPVDAAVTVCLLKEFVQNLSYGLSLVHHQRLGAAVTHQQLDYQLGEAAGWVELYLGLISLQTPKTQTYLSDFGFLQLLQSQVNSICLCLGFDLEEQQADVIWALFS